jgi:hypothetical protein
MGWSLNFLHLFVNFNFQKPGIIMFELFSNALHIWDTVPRDSSRLEREKPLGTVLIPWVKNISEKLKKIGNSYIRTIFKTKHTLKSSLMKTRPEINLKQMGQCIYSIPCEWGRSYIGETGRPLAIWLHEHWQNLRVSRLENQNWPNMRMKKVRE